MSSSDSSKIIMLPSLPGVRRDGTPTDSDYFNDAQWVRFVRGRPRKMGGYQEANSYFSGPIRSALFWSRQFQHLLCAFSEYGVEYSYLDQNGNGSNPVDISPAGFSHNPTALWSHDRLFDAASGANATLLLASPNNTLQNMDDPTLTPVYVTPLNTPGVLTPVADVKGVCSGGLFCTPPYAVLLGNDGNITWSDANSPQGYTTGDAGSARITGCKLVKGLPMRTGVSSGGMLWSLDSVLRMDFVGGSAIFKFSHLSTSSSILSQNSVIEYDGVWYWAGVDRFMTSNGIQVSELPNDMNLSWFYDNLNFVQRQKVFAHKVPRFGEIWWFFPMGNELECTHAVIYNVRYKIWYDAALSRASACMPAVYGKPVMTDSEKNDKLIMTLTLASGDLRLGDHIRGTISGAIAYISIISGTGPYAVLSTHGNDIPFITGELYANDTIAGAGNVSAVRPAYSVYTHEKGYDAIIEQTVSAIPAWFTTCDFGFPTGGPTPNATIGEDTYTKLVRLEPDFTQVGDMTLEVQGRQFASSTDGEPKSYPFSPTDGKIDLRDQVREVRLKFLSDETGGFFECGKTLIHVEPGDQRA